MGFIGYNKDGRGIGGILVKLFPKGRPPPSLYYFLLVQVSKMQNYTVHFMKTRNVKIMLKLSSL